MAPHGQCVSAKKTAQTEWNKHLTHCDTLVIKRIHSLTDNDPCDDPWPADLFWPRPCSEWIGPQVLDKFLQQVSAHFSKKRIKWWSKSNRMTTYDNVVCPLIHSFQSWNVPNWCKRMLLGAWTVTRPCFIDRRSSHTERREKGSWKQKGRFSSKLHVTSCTYSYLLTLRILE